MIPALVDTDILSRFFRNLERFRAFAEVNRILPLSLEATEHAAQLYAETRKLRDAGR